MEAREELKNREERKGKEPCTHLRNVEKLLKRERKRNKRGDGKARRRHL